MSAVLHTTIDRKQRPSAVAGTDVVNILIADDHELVREALAAYFAELWPSARIQQAATLDGALSVLGQTQTPEPDVVVLDLGMPGMEGAHGLRAMRQRLPKTPVCILSGTADRATALEMLRGGAAGFIPKTMRPQAMIAALKLVLAGERYLPSLLLTEGGAFGGAAMSSPAEEPRTTDPETGRRIGTLTNRETAVLGLLAEGSSNKEIARRLDIQEITVKSHMKSIFRKLDTRNRTQAAKIALECGVGAAA